MLTQRFGPITVKRVSEYASTARKPKSQLFWYASAFVGPLCWVQLARPDAKLIYIRLERRLRTWEGYRSPRTQRHSLTPLS